MANVGGFLAVHRFVSHVTGFATYIGIEIAYGNLFNMFSIMSVPCFFILGSMISGFLVDRKRLKGKSPSYFLTMSLVASCFFLVALLGNIGYFGAFGEPLDIYRDYFILVLLCMACGLQNAVITSVSGAVVRTTHLTGVSTDLGIGLVRVLFNRSTSLSSIKNEVKANWLRLGIILFFIQGSAIGGVLFLKYQYSGFYLPVLISFFVASRLYSFEQKSQP